MVDLYKRARAEIRKAYLLGCQISTFAQKVVALWRLCHARGTSQWGMGDVAEADKRRLLTLAEQAGGWVHWPGDWSSEEHTAGPVLCPWEEWEAVCERNGDPVGLPKWWAGSTGAALGVARNELGGNLVANKHLLNLSGCTRPMPCSIDGEGPLATDWYEVD